MEFAEITEDPFTNNTNNFLLVLDIQKHNFPTPSSPGAASLADGLLVDPTDNYVGFFLMFQYQDYEVTGSLSNEAYSHSYVTKREWMLVPPGFSFKSFQRLVGFWLSPAEVKQFILGRLALKGGD